MKEVYRARKVVKNRNGLVLCDSIVYLIKDGRQVIDSEQDLVTLPRYKFNKKGTFDYLYKPQTKEMQIKYYTILEKVA